MQNYFADSTPICKILYMMYESNKIRETERKHVFFYCCCCSVTQSCLTLLQFQGLQRTRPFCPSTSQKFAQIHAHCIFLQKQNFKFSLNSGMHNLNYLYVLNISWYLYIFSIYINIFSLRLSISIHYNSFLEFSLIQLLLL